MFLKMHWKNSARLGFRWLTKSIETIKLYKRSFSRCYSLCFYISMVSDTIRISMEPLTCSLSRSNLFLKELIFRWPNINLFILLIRISLRAFLASDCEKVESLDRQFSSLNKSSSKLKIQLPSVKLSKFFAKILLHFLLRCNFLTPKWSSFMLSWLINLRFF